MGSRQRKTNSHRYINQTKHNVRISMYIVDFLLFDFFCILLNISILFTAVGHACNPEPMLSGEPVPGSEPVSGGEPPLPPGLCSLEITPVLVVS